MFDVRACFIAVLLFLSSHGVALNIVLTNDDGWQSNNTIVLKEKLIAAGHKVILSGPCGPQSGKGGALTIYKGIPVNRSRSENNEYCVGDTDTNKSVRDYADGTPVVAMLFGLDILAPQYWGQPPDLVISGPNYGNNLGMLNNNSGTLGAAMIALGRGIPAIAVSADSISMREETQAPLIADHVITIVKRLIDSKEAASLLPAFTGLNVNLPSDLDNHKGFKLTRVGWNPGVVVAMVADLSKNTRMVGLTAHHLLETGEAKDMDSANEKARLALSGAHGLVFEAGTLGDAAPDSEAAALYQGYITISVIDGSIQAQPQPTDAVSQRLKTIVSQEDPD